MTTARVRAVVVVALAAGAGVCALVLASDHQDAKAAFAIFGPAVGWGFIGTGLYAWRREPDNRTGMLMVLLGFAWLSSTLESANSALLYTYGLTLGGLWGSLFLHLGMSFPTGRLRNRFDRGVVIAGYVIFPLAFVPELLFAGPAELDCADCPTNVLLFERDEDLARVGMALGGLLYDALFLVALVRATQIWRSAGPFVRLQLTPVYVSALFTFLLVTVARRQRRRLVGRVHLRLADAVRVPGRAAPEPDLDVGGRAARFAGTSGRGRGRGAPEARARPARRRAVALGRAGAAAALGAQAGRRRPRAREAARPGTGRARDEPG